MAAPCATGDGFLKDVVAYVEVWSSTGTENYSRAFASQLVDMGAKVSKTFNKQVTHVVFKDGYQSTWDRAKKRGAKLVSVLWVEKCRTAGAHVDESLFPAVNAKEHLPTLLRKKRRCMQPKDFIPKTPENDRRLQRKFEKMTEELQRQRMTAGMDAPVLLFESGSSLTYRHSKAFSSHQEVRQTGLQETNGNKQDLSVPPSPKTAQTQKSPGAFSCNVAHGHLCPGEPLNSKFCPSMDGPCGDQEESWRVSARGASAFSSRLAVDGIQSPPPPPSPSQSRPREPEEERSCQRDFTGELASPDQARAASALEKMAEKHSVSLALSTEVHLLVHSRASSSTKRKRSVADLSSPPKEKLKRRRSHGGRPAPLSPIRMGPSPPPAAQPASLSPDCVTASFEDYFSPTNLKERRPDPHAPSQLLAPPSPFSSQSLSKRERRTILEMSDFSCMREKSRPVNMSDFMAKPDSHFHKPAVDRGSPTWSWMASEEPAAAVADSPGHSGQAGPLLGGGPHPEVSSQPLGVDPPPPPGPPGSLGPGQSSSKDARELMATKGTQEEGALCKGSEARGDGRPGFGEDLNAKKDPEDKENLSSGCNENVKIGPERHGLPDSPCTALQDCVRPEEPKGSATGKKPARTLVMTSMPSEKQNIIMQVVKRLQGFSIAPEVGEGTTHVLAGRPVRTLSVLLGLARGCWVLSYEWVLWSLELGHWISEEPFELSTHFPAAPLRRRERQLCAGQYQGTLFADERSMFITPASSPPRAKLCELVLLCGGHVSPSSHRASIVVGPYSGKKNAATKYLSEKWVLDSITQNRVCNFEDYLLPQ
ncbi:microcephalin [Thomomys bottae]